MLNADYDTATVHLSKEVIFEVDFVCVVSRKSKFASAITLKQYLAAEHVGVDIVGGVQTHPNQGNWLPFARNGIVRSWWLNTL